MNAAVTWRGGHTDALELLHEFEPENAGVPHDREPSIPDCLASWWPQRDSNPRLGLERAAPPLTGAYLGTSCHGAWPRYLILELAGSHLTRPLSGQILGRIERLTWHPT